MLRRRRQLHADRAGGGRAADPFASGTGYGPAVDVEALRTQPYVGFLAFDGVDAVGLVDTFGVLSPHGVRMFVRQTRERLGVPLEDLAADPGIARHARQLARPVPQCLVDQALH